MANIVLSIFVISFIAAVFGGFFFLCNWAEENHRVPFFVKWYLNWNKAEGCRRLASAKKG